jgi:hypothetical protein
MRMTSWDVGMPNQCESPEEALLIYMSVCIMVDDNASKKIWVTLRSRASLQ